MTTSRNRAMTLLAVSFVVGVVVGGGALGMAVRAGKATWVWRTSHPNTARPGDPGPRGTAYGVYVDSVLKLGLNQSVKDSITAVYRHGATEMNALSRSMWVKMDSVVQPYRVPLDSIRTQTRSEMRALLPEAQRTRFDSLMKAVDEMRQRRRQQGPGGGRGDGGRGGDGGGRGGPGDGPNSGGRGGPGGPGQPGGGGFERGPI